MRVERELNPHRCVVADVGKTPDLAIHAGGCEITAELGA